MKNVLIVVALLLTVAACTSENKEAEIADNELVELANETNCYLLTEGTENQDSTFIRLEIRGDSVTGAMHWQPWQKDGAMGTISAVKTGDVIRGMYDYMIEGSQQQEEVIFKLADGKLLKGVAELQETDSTQVHLRFKDISKVEYSIVLPQVNCEKLKGHGF